MPRAEYGETHHSAKLTESAVANLRRALRSASGRYPLIVARVAARRSISPAAVSMAATGRTWRHMNREHPPAPAWDARCERHSR